jgi:hypothetical protein
MLGSHKILETTTPSRDVWGDFNGSMCQSFLVNLNELSKHDTTDSEGKIKGFSPLTLKKVHYSPSQPVRIIKTVILGRTILCSFLSKPALGRITDFLEPPSWRKLLYAPRGSRSDYKGSSLILGRGQTETFVILTSRLSLHK